MVLEVENIKCGGCASSISQKLLDLDSVREVNVDIDNGRVTVEVEGDAEVIRESILTALAAMGYPEKGSVEGLRSVKAKATSYVSCAIGRMSD